MVSNRAMSATFSLPDVHLLSLSRLPSSVFDFYYLSVLFFILPMFVFFVLSLPKALRIDSLSTSIFSLNHLLVLLSFCKFTTLAFRLRTCTLLFTTLQSYFCRWTTHLAIALIFYFIFKMLLHIPLVSRSQKASFHVALDFHAAGINI